MYLFPVTATLGADLVTQILGLAGEPSKTQSHEYMSHEERRDEGTGHGIKLWQLTALVRDPLASHLTCCQSHKSLSTPLLASQRRPGTVSHSGQDDQELKG